MSEVRTVAVDWAGRPVTIEHQWLAAPDAGAPVMVFLHEGLGSVAMWKDFPRLLCEAVGMRGLVYSRPGYGGSTPRPAHEHWGPDYLHRQAIEVLPALLDALGVAGPVWLFGHSDGASIALIHAATFAQAVAGLVVVAPHIVVEEFGLASIRAARQAYLATGLRAKLARYHDDVDSAFWGWNDIWLDPRFKALDIRPLLPAIRCPVLAVQGRDDEYGTLEQIRGIARVVPHAQLREIAACGHSPQRDQATALVEAVRAFTSAPRDFGGRVRFGHHPQRNKTMTDTTASYPDTRLLIAGEWRDATGARTIPVVNPATGEAIGRVAHASVADLDLALAAAQKGFEAWRNTPANERATMMRKAAGLLRERADAIARLLTQEQGKPLAESRVEVLAGADIIEWFADEGRRVYGRIVPSRNLAAQQLVLKEPVGPVAAFTPWNFPINQIVRKLGAALATGCSFLVKAPEETPASPAALLQTFVDAGVPAGTVGLVFGDPAEISSYLIASPIIRKVTFTGSTPVGKQLAALAGSHMKRVTMELGGHAPVIVAEDADVALAVKAAGGAKFRNAGQVCISPTRFLVHSSLRDEFAAALVKHAQGLKLGDGLVAGTNIGPLANGRRVTAMAKVMDDARAKGARIATGGERVGGTGNFFAPTVLTDVPLDADVFNNEPFGPVAAIRAFDTLDEAISEANRLPFGLAGYAFTKSIKTAHLLGQRLELGMLWINQPATPSPEMPFGGVKDSGYGTEGGPEALESYLVTKAVSILGI